MIFQKILIVLIFLLTAAYPVYAEPMISSVSGAGNHGNSITIIGSGFGTKSPAAPLLWDDCEDKTVNSTSAVSSEGGYNVQYPISAGEEFNIQYRTIPHRNTPGPHRFSTKYLTGGHKNVPAGETRVGNKVGVGIDAGSQYASWYTTFYHTVDPLWPSQNDNFKYTHRKDAACSYGCGGDYGTYWEYDVPFRGEGETTGRMHSDICGNRASMVAYPGDYSNPQKWHSDPRNEWVRHEERLKHGDGGLFNVYQNNEHGISFECTDPFGGWDPRSFLVGGFWRKSRNPDQQDDNAFRYFDDIYIDTTLARVMLANNPNYHNATRVEPQIPSAWSNTSITTTVNQGSFADCETVYLFIFDANNNHNAVGYTVRIVTGAGKAPCPPIGGKIVQ